MQLYMQLCVQLLLQYTCVLSRLFMKYMQLDEPLQLLVRAILSINNSASTATVWLINHVIKKNASLYGCMAIDNHVRTVLVTQCNSTWQLNTYTAIIHVGHVAIAVKVFNQLQSQQNTVKCCFVENLHNYAPS